MQTNVIRYGIIFLSLFLTSTVFAASEYSNELVSVDLDQTSENSVKVNIYTDKPYKEQIIVNKKPNNKYVILLPETSNSMNVQPDISGTSALRDVEVKTQQYSSLPGKGYTKITIDSKTPIEIVPQAFVTKKASTSSTKRTANKQFVTPQQVQMTVPQRVLNQQRPATNNDFTSSSYDRQRQISSQQTVLPQQTQQTYVRRETSVPQILPRQTESTYAPQSQTHVLPAVQTQNAENTVNQSASEPAAEEVTENDNNKSAIDDENANYQVENGDISDDELAFFKKLIRFKQKVIRKIKQILSVRISFASFMTVLQLILLLVLVKIISDLVKKVQNPNEQVQPVTRRLIHDNDETFEQAYPSYSNMDVYNAHRNDFEEDNKEGFNVTPLSAPVSFTSKNNVQKNQFSNGLNYRQPKLYSAQNDFYKPLNEINEEDKMSIFDENAQDIEKTIFKNPLTKISKHDEETLFDEVEPYEENSPFADEKYNTSDDFFNYSNSEENEEDFFIFEDEDDDEDVEYQEDYVEDEDEYEYLDEDEYDYEEDEEYEEDDLEQSQDEYSQEEQTVQQEEPKTVDPFEHLTVHSKYVIDSNRGFAQVSVDDVNALIGYVGSKISVIRKFKEQVNGTMQVRMNEQPAPDTMIYIVKVGSCKTLVEVKPDNIRQLLDL